MHGEIPLYAGSEDAAAGLILKIPVSADMICVGMGVVYGDEFPFVSIEYLPDLSSGVLVVPAVYQAYFAVTDTYKAYFCGTLDIICPVGHLYELEHFRTSLTGYAMMQQSYDREPFKSRKSIDRQVRYELEFRIMRGDPKCSTLFRSCF